MKIMKNKINMETDVKAKFDELEKKVLDLQNGIETKFDELIKQITNLRNARLANPPVQTADLKEKSDSLGKKIAEKIDHVSTGHLVMLSLYVKTNQTTLDIQQMIKGWGWSPDTFFEKGHFSSDLVKKGFVHDVSGKDDKKNTYSLTSKGELFTVSLIKKYQLS